MHRAIIVGILALAVFGCASSSTMNVQYENGINARVPICGNAGEADVSIRDTKTLVSLDVVDMPLSEVYYKIAQQTGANILVPRAPDTRITARFHNAPCISVLDALARAYGLWPSTEKDSGLIVIDPSVVKDAGEDELEPLRRSYFFIRGNSKELLPIVEAGLSERGKAFAVTSPNALVVTDIWHGLRNTQTLLERLGVLIRQWPKKE